MKGQTDTEGATRERLTFSGVAHRLLLFALVRYINRDPYINEIITYNRLGREIAVPAIHNRMYNIPPARTRNVPTPNPPILVGSTSIRKELPSIVILFLIAKLGKICCTPK